MVAVAIREGPRTRVYTCPEITEVLISIGIGKGTFPVGKIFFERSYIHITIGIGFCALSVFFTFLDLTNIFVTISEGVFTLSMKNAILESTYIGLTRRIRLSALTVFSTVFPLSDIFAPIGFCKSTQSALQTVLEGTHINVAIGRIIRSLSVQFIFLEIANICVPGKHCRRAPSLFALPGLYAVRPSAFIFAPIRPRERSLSVEAVFQKLPNIFITIGKCKCSFAGLNALIEAADIFVTVRIS